MPESPASLLPPTPAATLVLMRPVAGGPPELLMMERTAHMVFAAGALVFPGGRIDPQDHEAASDEMDAAKIAAIRETIEETGIAPGLSPSASPAQAQRLRDGLAAGRTLSELLAEEGLGLALGDLTPFARWCPNFAESRRFDTLFFVAAAPEGAPEPTVQAGEGERVLWASAAAILAEVAAGRAHAIFPTRRNLDRLAQFASIDEARADAAAFPVRKIVPWVEKRGDRDWLCIPADAGYPVTAEPLERARRF